MLAAMNGPPGLRSAASIRAKGDIPAQRMRSGIIASESIHPAQ
jgi:hypothetical protein